MRKLNIFIISFLLSLPLWAGINIFQTNLEELIYAKMIEISSSYFLTAQISSRQPFYNNPQIPKPEILAQNALLVTIDKNNKEQIIFQKEKDLKIFIASLTKLMTAIIADEFYKPELKIKISASTVEQPEATGFLKVDEFLKVQDLLYVALIESSNDAAYALAEPIGIEGFVSLMNLKAKEIGLKNTHFFNPTGIDAVEATNFSTAEDLKELARYLLKKPLLLEILSQKEYHLYLENRYFHHILYNTNELLREIPEIIAGKTGYTPKAGGCLLLIFKKQNPEIYFIAIVLNSPDRFNDTKKLIKYALSS